LVFKGGREEGGRNRKKKRRRKGEWRDGAEGGRNWKEEREEGERRPVGIRSASILSWKLA
jgi:hypothetical protein